MSHWYRAPRAISLSDLLARSKQSIIVDYSIPAELVAELPARGHGIGHLRIEGHWSPEETVHLCQRSRGILLTVDTAYVPLLSTETRNPWGLILLSDEKRATVEGLRRLTSEHLMVRPSVGSKRHV